jgi:hypothetical protein
MLIIIIKKYRKEVSLKRYLKIFIIVFIIWDLYLNRSFSFLIEFRDLQKPVNDGMTEFSAELAMEPTMGEMQ